MWCLTSPTTRLLWRRNRFIFWKKFQIRTFVTEEEKALPGHKPMKDRLTLLMCRNANGDFKVKPLFVYHSGYPLVLKRSNVMKIILPVMWRQMQRLWILFRWRCSCGDTFTCNCPILVLNKVYYYYYYYSTFFH